MDLHKKLGFFNFLAFASPEVRRKSRKKSKDIIHAKNNER